MAPEGLTVDVEVLKELGTYEHFYDVADVPDSDGKQCVANRFVAPAGLLFLTLTPSTTSSGRSRRLTSHSPNTPHNTCAT